MSVRASFNKAAPCYNQYAVLQKEVAARLFFNLQLVKKAPAVVLDLGAGTGFLTQLLMDGLTGNPDIIAVDFAEQSLLINQQQTTAKAVCANAYQLPFNDNSADIIVSNLMLQWCGDIDTVFDEFARVLTADGLLMFSTFGVDSLSELKKSWAVADNKSHVNNFIDMHTLGDALVNHGFADPIMTMEMFTLTYESVRDLMRDLKGIGANCVDNRARALTGKNTFQTMLAHYETLRQDGKLPASYEVIYGHAFKIKKNTADIAANAIGVETLSE